MKALKIVSAAALMLGLGLLSGAAQATDASCDRACLKGLADKLVDSMVAHRPSAPPLTQTYAATENSVPAALNMMVAWRTATGTKGRFYIIDPVSHQLYMIVTLVEGPNDTLLFGRIKAQGKKISEVEIFENRSRGQGGFQYSGEGLANMPEEWTKPVAVNRLPSRAELLRFGQSIFDSRIDGPPVSNDCVLMENGKIVAENPSVAVAVGGGGPKKIGKAYIPNPDGSVPIPCGTPKPRPTDPKARTDIIDTEQGIVVSMAIVQGVTEPYLVTNPTESAYVPNQILKPYADMLKAQQKSGKYTGPALRPMAAMGTTAHILRIYDGKLQAMTLLINLSAPGGHSPWVK